MEENGLSFFQQDGCETRESAVERSDGCCCLPGRWSCPRYAHLVARLRYLGAGTDTEQDTCATDSECKDVQQATQMITVQAGVCKACGHAAVVD